VNSVIKDKNVNKNVTEGKMKFLSIVCLFICTTVSAQVMLIQTHAETLSIPLAEIQSITFSQDSSAEPELLTQAIPLALLKNYPNPFNPETNIVFEIGEPGFVEVMIFNIKGQKVKTLLSKQLEFGKHEIQWQGDDSQGKKVSSGVYLYKITHNQNEKFSKMLLLK
jgi:hypothetical protein